MARYNSGAHALGQPVPEALQVPEDIGASSVSVALPPFETIYRQHFDFVWSSTRRLGVNPASVDDVVQEIFMVIHSKLHTLRQPQSLRSWVYGITRRTASDHHRSQRTRTSSGAAFATATEVLHVPVASPADLSEQNEQVKLLWSLLDGMDPIKREVFILAEIEELTAPEIAEALEIPLNTAYSRLRAARQVFEEAVARDALRRGGGA